MLLASIAFAFTGAFAKVVSADIPSVEVVFFRNFIGLLLIGFAIFKNPVRQKGGKPWLLFFRGFAGAISILAFFYNIANMGLAEAFTFSKTAPIFVSFIAALFLKEKLSFISWFAILGGFIGIIFVMQPELGFKKTDVMGILNGFFAALAYLSVHDLRKYYDTKVIVLSFVLIGSVTPLMLMIVSEFFVIPAYFDFMAAKFVLPKLSSWTLIILMGICGILYQTYLTKAFAASKKAGPVAVISYSDIIFTMILGLFLGDSLPNMLGALGIILIIISGIAVAMDNK
ncbi:EamA family transporter [Campylobacter blaseri]|uniref:EamA family transporter n=2 Tax=Campylobacter blaseri TaxID=2042961 RepID=A0A2P8R1J7_9BACT|nr:EamA family transporter [Campylobacter blaseri]PSM54138.1 EamA family transporter [Campylobacter blaseri]